MFHRMFPDVDMKYKIAELRDINPGNLEARIGVLEGLSTIRLIPESRAYRKQGVLADALSLRHSVRF